MLEPTPRDLQGFIRTQYCATLLMAVLSTSNGRVKQMLMLTHTYIVIRFLSSDDVGRGGEKEEMAGGW